jgi:hypothetical protein
MRQMLQNNKYNQSGNVFIVILIGVFLFSALLYMFARSAQQGTGNITQQQAKVAAQEVLNYARLIEGGVDRIRRNGCSESEISFENSFVAGYNNARAPLDNSCHVFDDNGGKISYTAPSTNWLDAANDTEIFYNELLFPEGSCVIDVGTGGSTCNTANNETTHDIVLIIPWIKRELCITLNNDLNVENPSGEPPIDNGRVWLATNDKFVGNFPTTAGYALQADTSENHTSACIAADPLGDQPGGGFHFYHVLLAR